MSHVVEIQTEVRDPVAIRAACDRLALPPPVYGETRLYQGSRTGWAVQLPKWRYPVVCDTDSGEIALDNFEGRWGDQKELDSLLQIYCVEKARIEARKRGHDVLEQPLEDGFIKLTVTVGGAA